MRKILILSVLILVTISSATFQRPWLNKTWVVTNPNIWTYGIEYWWNLPEFDKTISTLEPEQLYGLNLPSHVQEYIDKSGQYGDKSKSDISMCILHIITAVGTFAPTQTFIVAFANSSSCRNYKRDWIKSVDYSLLALEESEKEAKISLYSTRESYEKIKFMGLCDQNYTGPGSTSCNEVKTVFVTIDNNLPEGNYGKYALFDEYTETIRKELSSPIPNLNPFGSTLRLVWEDGGIIDSFAKIKQLSDGAILDAENEYQFRLKSAGMQKSEAESILVKLKNQNLHLITSGVMDFGLGKFGSIDERLVDLEKQTNIFADLYSYAQIEHGYVTKQSYLATSILILTKIDSEYLGILTKAQILEEDAKSAVRLQKSEAEQEITATEKYFFTHPPSSDALSFYESARKKLNEGDHATILGTVFVAYSKAAAFARSARESGSVQEEANRKASIAKLRDLIYRAEQDDITVIDEKETLILLASLSSYNTDQLVQTTINNIIVKARIQYESDLLTTRERIYDKIRLSGTEDLLLTMNKYENGIIEDEEINFLKGIGSLKKLKTNYLSVEKELDKYIWQIVGNSMATSASPIFGVVLLDQPTELILDVVLVNGPYSTSNVEVPVYIGSELPFLYSDITRGKDEVKGMFIDDGLVIFILKSVKPNDVKRITLEKSMVVAHTISSERKVEAMGGGLVNIFDKITFELDCSVPRIEFPNDGIVDGSIQSGFLSPGRHIFTSEMTTYGYEEEVNNIRTTRFDSKTKIEYEVSIFSEFDLATLPIFLNSENDSRISSFNVVISGAGLKEKKQISESQFAIVLSNVKKDVPIIVAVSYFVDDPVSFVADQIGQLQSDSEEANDFLEEAEYQASLGNYDEALEYIEEDKAASSDYEKQQTKLETKYETLSAKANNEIESIASLLETGESSEIIDKLATRKTELEKVLTENSTIDQKINELENFDFNWLPKEITAFKKEVYKQYNNLKERFYSTGNTSNPEQFLILENALNKLETTGKPEYLANVSKTLDQIKILVENQERVITLSQSNLAISFESIKSEIFDLLDKYNKQASAAKGTDYSSIFTESSTKLNKLITDAENLVNKDGGSFFNKLKEINTSKEKIENIMDSLKYESETKFSLVSDLINNGQLDNSKIADLSAKAQTMRDMIDNGDYVNALRTGSTILKEVDSGKIAPNNLLLLGVTALAILAGAGYYMMQPQKPKELKELPSMKPED
ncbi:MAG: hypothetical protein ABID61_01480 [Candidatus Micrarchaeota archaeon]